MAQARSDPPRPLGVHAVLEASAGTGKTHAIVEQVLALLSSGTARLPQILVLTFTEKAAAELRRRVRQGLLQAVAERRPAQENSALQAALQVYSQAAIFTLHGFCNRVLREFGFENGMPFQLTQVDDGEVFEIALRQVQRRDWPQWYGADLPWMLTLSGYPQRQKGISEWERRLKRLTAEYRPQAQMRLEPAAAASVTPSQLIAAAQHLADTLATFSAALPGGSPAEKADAWYGQLLMPNHRRRKKTSDCLQELLALSPALRSWAQQPASAAAAVPEIRADLVTYLTEREAEAARGPGQAHLQQALVAFTGWQAILTAVEHSLTLRTLAALQATAREYKQERGWISFDDMIDRVDEQLEASAAVGGAGLLQALRQRYRCALIDEFQDTDPLQWRILRRIFVDTPAGSPHSLTIIGDPKQSIYRFRRADIQTYLQARTVLSAGRPLQSLAVNWRSTPELLDLLNRFFAADAVTGDGAGGWFRPAETQIEFIPVRAPEPALRLSHVTVDRTGRGPVTVLSQSPANLGLQRWRQARAIATEISRLLADGGTGFQFSIAGSKSRARPLAPGDIAILVPRRKSIPPIVRALEAAGIAASSYKQGGLFESDEALQVVTMLQAIERPGDRERLKRALLTRFFGFTPQQIIGFDGFEPGHPAPQWLARWAQLATERRWSRLTASLLRDTGVVARELTAADGERRVSNLRQVLEYFGTVAYSQKLSLPAAIRALVAAAEVGVDDETDLQRIDTERSKVQIMTIHASKGLEFPVVFLAEAAKLGSLGQETRWQFHEPNGTLVLDLAKSQANQPRHEAEAQQELARLFYVAMTRARFKLYLPAFLAKNDNHTEFVQRLLQVFPESADGPVAWVSWADSQPPAAPLAAGGVPDVALVSLPVLPPNLETRRTAIESFTHLRGRWQPFGSESHDGMGGALQFGEIELLEEAGDDRLEAPLLSPTPGAELRSLGGVEFGTLVHDVLEAVDFAAVAAATTPIQLLQTDSIRRLIESHAQRLYGAASATAAAHLRRGAPELTDRLQQAIDQTAELVWKALHTPLPMGPAGEMQALCRLMPADCLRELEFQYRLQAAPPPTGLTGDAHLYGFIDILFRFRPSAQDRYRYFVLDWKTNRLEPDYAPATLATCMQAEGYHLQHRLYTLGVIDWLAAKLPEFEPARDFGGAFYLFLRGLNGIDASTGVHFTPAPDSQALRELRSAVRSAIASGDIAAGRRLLHEVATAGMPSGGGGVR